MSQSPLTTDGSCVKVKGRNYTVRLIPVKTEAQGNVMVPKNCNSWIVENYGGVIAYVNLKPVLPPPSAGLSGESYGMSGNDGDCFVGEISITFAAGANPLVYVSFFIYTE